ncbi:hypothetical protein AURDEDRAFT_186859 [Auricularia subglabra TFB-10046 SS5]|uniref:Uncharacterized protein n=1 Tax=Auricularia subglabra (strain TFB-10046 / SS5) TaxID=717982 RepID=J0D2D0_AURST|nr:hypothetical protein AURDEDRAFT_186859 [Auricularia subglabra TFB-10046 SS5]
MNSEFERGYASTLAALQRPGSIEPETVLAALSHYLAHLAVPHQTSLTRAAVLSPLHATPGCPALLALAHAFESATHQRAQLLEQNPRKLFSRSAHSELSLWLRAVLEGTTSSPELLKIAILGGVLQAISDSKQQYGRAASNIENELVVAFASAMSNSDASTAVVTRVLGATFLQFVPNQKLAALDLPVLATFFFDSLTTLYGPTHFVTYLSAVSKNGDELLSITPNSPLAQAINRTLQDPQYPILPAVSRLIARAVAILADDKSRRLPRVMDDIARALESLSARVEATWTASPLSATQSETEIEPASRPLTQSLWTAFKTLLFATTLIKQSMLSVLIVEPHSSAPALAAIALRTFASLAFVLAQFGGIAAPGGVPELRRAAFNALDVVATDGAESDVLVRALADDVTQSKLAHDHPVWRAKTAYALACIEQLVPVLSDTCIQQVVVPLCEPHLREPSHRETFEAAHSTILAVFAWAGQRLERGDAQADVFGRELIPGYVQALSENAGEGGLRPPQLRLAVTGAARATMHEPALALLLVDSVLNAPISAASVPSATTSPQSSATSNSPSSSNNTVSTASSSGLAAATQTDGPRETLRRGLMLASLLPVLPPRLLPRVLNELRATAASPALSTEQVQDLGDAIYEEISERAGDAARPALVRWWMDNESVFVPHRAAKL